jgi:selenide,water dikinase
MRSAIPIDKRIVLLGAGNAHLQIVKWWGMNPIPGTTLTLITDSLSTLYSGMIPGYIAGGYSLEEISIDISRLCAVSGADLVRARASGIDAQEKTVRLDDRPGIGYDLLSLNVGSKPMIPSAPFDAAKLLPLKPFASLPERIIRFDEQVANASRELNVRVIGGGAGGFEIGLALRKRWESHAHVSFELLTAGDRVLSSAPRAVSRHGENVLREKGILARLQCSVVGGDVDEMILSNGESIPYDLCVWATAAEPLEFMSNARFALDERGYVQVHDTLQLVSQPDLFAAGDCASLASHPDLPKAGIFSVRSGPVLWENLRRHGTGRKLRSYRPQPIYLFLLNTSDGSAIMNYGGVAGRGSWAWRWKDFIDRRWMNKFHDAYAEIMQSSDDVPEISMRCGGCGAKVGAEILHGVLEQLDIPSHPDVLSGVSQGDDASVHRAPPGLLEVQSVDFFREFISDPYLFGEIAALNALSDLYAMNAAPFAAQAIVTVPYAADLVRREQLRQVLSGALAVFSSHDVTLSGGHTSESADFQIGFSVTGYAKESELFRNENLRPGDQLVLTKPLGSGALLRAHMLGQCPAAWFDRLVNGLRSSNRSASKILADHGVTACTDVTGFGLGGHLLEMLDAANLCATIESSRVPVYPGFQEIASRTVDRIVSTLHEDNARIRSRVAWVDMDQQEWLFDPQTSGGLLGGVDAQNFGAVVEDLKNAGYPDAACVGQAEKPEAGAARIRVT